MRNPLNFILVILISLFLNGFSHRAAAGPIYIPVGEAKVKKSLLAFPEAVPTAGDKKQLGRAVRDLILGDLAFTNLFNFQSPSAFIEKPGAGLTLDTFKISDWTTIGTEFLIKSGLSLDGENVAYELRLYDVTGAKQIMGKRYVAKPNEAKILAHSAANDIVEALTGKKGIFFTRLAMVCNKTGRTEIWVTDFDGSSPRQLTSHRTRAFAPAWSPDGKQLAYSLYTRNGHNVENIDLYEYDFNSKRSRLMSNRKGINSGASYSPDGKGIAMTMSFLGNPEIFYLDRASREVTRLTKSLGFDVDPSWSPNGQNLAWVSSRSSLPMVYMSDLSSLRSNPSAGTRLTFAGKYNATPSWSPAGNRIAFAGYNESHFDIFLMNTDGTGLERLTKDEGSNEDPDFSPDGNFIAFSSNRSGQKNVYIISVDGTYTKRLTFGLGACVAPRWSRYPTD